MAGRKKKGPKLSMTTVGGGWMWDEKKKRWIKVDGAAKPGGTSKWAGAFAAEDDDDWPFGVAGSGEAVASFKGASKEPEKLEYSAGGVLIDDKGRVLLRHPTGCFGGYSWTFAKGRVDAGESDKEAALREVLEETGWHAKIVAKIPGEYLGSTTKNVYFLMRPVRMDDTPADRDDGDYVRPGFKYPHWETDALRWVSYKQAIKLISLTKYVAGRDRDLAILDAAYRVWKSRR